MDRYRRATATARSKSIEATSESTAHRHRRGGTCGGRGRAARLAVGLRRVLARDLAVRAADQSFGNGVRGRQHGEIDLQQRVEGIVVLAQGGKEIRHLFR